MSHVGLGSLTEYGVLVLFGNAHSHALVEGTGLPPDEIRDTEGLDFDNEGNPGNPKLLPRTQRIGPPQSL